MYSIDQIRNAGFTAGIAQQAVETIIEQINRMYGPDKDAKRPYWLTEALAADVRRIYERDGESRAVSALRNLSKDADLPVCRVDAKYLLHKYCIG